MEQGSLDTEVRSADWVVQRYGEANALLGQKHYGQAIARYEEVISQGARSGDPMVLKLVSAALRLRAQCQFHLWQSQDKARNNREGQTNQFGQRWRGLLEQKRGDPK